MAGTRIAVKFCGGCNPGYNRRVAYDTIRDEVMTRAERDGCHEVDFEKAEEGVLYDVLLVINGCANRCAAIAEFRSKTPPVYVWNENEIENAIDSIAEQIRINAPIAPVK
jgi:hypothetical protein